MNLFVSQAGTLESLRKCFVLSIAVSVSSLHRRKKKRGGFHLI